MVNSGEMHFVLNPVNDGEGDFTIHLTQSHKKKQREKERKVMARLNEGNMEQISHNLRSKGKSKGKQ